MTTTKESLLSVLNAFKSDADFLANISQIKDTELSLILGTLYPVGAIYMSIDPTDPSRLFGGKWQALNEGRVLIGAGDKYPVGTKGGEETHTLSTDELPSHSHRANTGSGGSHCHAMPWGEINNGEWPYDFGYWDSSNNKLGCYSELKNSFDNYKCDTSSNGYHSHSVYGSINNEGSNAPHNNMMPFQAVYMWHRVA